MSKLSTKKKLSLGIFVTVAVILSLALVYYLGSRRQWFGDNITAYTYFYNVSGLQAGNNVRFSGINVGTVNKIRLASDSSVLAELIISREASSFIKIDSRAVIESDGLMGNKVVSISAGSVDAPHISDNDTLDSRSPVSLDAVISSFKSTSDNANDLTRNLKLITEQIQKSQGLLGKLVADSVMALRIENTIRSFEQTSENTRRITAEVQQATRRLNTGDGIAPRLLRDTTLSNTLVSTIDTLSMASRSLAATSRELERFAARLNNEEGAVNLLLTDTVFARNLEATLRNVQEGTRDLDKVVNTVNESWLLNLFSGSDDDEEEENKKKK